MESRVIKVRVWNNYTKRFESKGFLTSSSETDKSYLLCGVMEFEQTEDEYGDDGENVEIEQFTGLKDVNGKDIFEGDIVKVISMKIIKTVLFHKCAFGININEHIFSPIYQSEDLEVIGNIHQHPELLLTQ